MSAATTTQVQPELIAALKRLRLGRIAETLAERLALAEAQGMATEDLLMMAPPGK